MSLKYRCKGTKKSEKEKSEKRKRTKNEEFWII